MLAMFDPGENLALGRSGALEFVGDEHARHVGPPLEEFTEELLRRLLVAPTLDQDIEDVAVLIHRSLQIVLFALDGQEQSSSVGEFHPHALTELDVNLSIHPAL